MPMNPATLLKHKKQSAKAASDLTYKQMSDSYLESGQMYRLVNLADGKALDGVMSFDEFMKKPNRNLYELHKL